MDLLGLDQDGTGKPHKPCAQNIYRRVPATHMPAIDLPIRTHSTVVAAHDGIQPLSRLSIQLVTIEKSNIIYFIVFTISNSGLLSYRSMSGTI